MEIDARVPSLLEESTTTTYTPVCMRFDQSTLQWTSSGVTTVENSSPVSCVVTQAGKITVIYEASSTTTPVVVVPTEESGGSGGAISIVLIVGVAAAGLILLVVVIVCCVKCRKKRRPSKMAIPSNKVMPTDMSDFEGVHTVGNKIHVQRASSEDFMVEHARTTKMTATNRPLAVGDASDLSRSFDYMVQEEKSDAVRAGEVDSPDKLIKKKEEKRK